MKINWFCPILHRNCLLKHVIERRIEETIKWGRRRKQLLDDVKEKRRYWKLKDRAVDCTLWITHFGRSYGPLVRQYAVNQCWEVGDSCTVYQTTVPLGRITWLRTMGWVVNNLEMSGERNGLALSRNDGNKWNIVNWVTVIGKQK